jgi:hypothetical protein
MCEVFVVFLFFFFFNGFFSGAAPPAHSNPGNVETIPVKHLKTFQTISKLSPWNIGIRGFGNRKDIELVLYFRRRHNPTQGYVDHLQTTV